MHESTKQKIDEHIFNCPLDGQDLYLSTMLYFRKIAHWSDNDSEVEQYVFNHTILKDGV